jgi:acetoin utilization protein AcuB
VLESADVESSSESYAARFAVGFAVASSTRTVRDVMTRDPFVLEPEDSLMKALEIMRLHGVRRIPIVLAGMLVGLLAEGDLKRAQPSILSESQDDFNRIMDGTPISRIMIQNPMTIAPDLPLLTAAETLHTMKFGALPVVEDGKVVGILTDSDLLRALVDILRAG